MTETRWTYVTPADGLSTKLHLPGCRMMMETEKLGRVRTVEGYWADKAPWELGDLLCQHCQKRADPLPKIREKLARVRTPRPDSPPPRTLEEATAYIQRLVEFLPGFLVDVDWLIAEVERLRSRT